ncbi:tetratricopeptide repeat protein [Roseibium sp. M-1]
MLRFAGFELDEDRAELRSPEGHSLRLRPKTFELLRVFAATPGKVLSKHELMTAVWPNVHVGDDSLFQCVKELRSALGDETRQLIKVVSGRGYMFDADVSEAEPVKDETASPQSTSSVSPAAPSDTASAQSAQVQSAQVQSAIDRNRSWSAGWPVATIALFLIAIVVAAGVFDLLPRRLFERPLPSVTLQVAANDSDDPQAKRMAERVAEVLTDGLASIGTIRVVAPSVSNRPADYVVKADLAGDDRAWTLRARLTDTIAGEIKWTTSLTIDRGGSDAERQPFRLAAGLGHDLALTLNALLNGPSRSPDDLPTGSARVAIEQATAAINQTSKERFRDAQRMLERALAEDSDSVEIQVALAALKLRGVQMVWYDPGELAAAQASARAVLDSALKSRPDYIPTHEAYCRLLNAMNEFNESLVTCARTLTFDPWNGIARYHIGLAQLQLGRFEDALGSFEKAELFDTPQVSRWTWRIGAGWALLLLDRPQEAIPWLESSIAITPGSGRTHMLLAAALQQLGHTDDARTAMAKGLELRPGSTVQNVPPPMKNSSPLMLEATMRIMQLMADAGLPET